ncbi:cysteine peptidase family C39 domain-containing protein [Streptococcus agalactiae]
MYSIEKLYGSKYSLNDLRELAKTNRDGTTSSGIIAGTTK